MIEELVLYVMPNSYLLIQFQSLLQENTYSLKNGFKNSYKQFTVFTEHLLYLKRTSLWEK